MSQWSWGTVSSTQEPYNAPSITSSASFRVPLGDATKVEEALLNDLAQAPAVLPGSPTNNVSLQIAFSTTSKPPLLARLVLCKSLGDLFSALALVRTGDRSSAVHLLKQYKRVGSAMCARGASATPQVHPLLLQTHASKGARRVMHSLVQMFRTIYDASVHFCKCTDRVVHDFGNGAFGMEVLAQCARSLQQKVQRECARANRHVYSYSGQNYARTATIDAQAIDQVQTVYACAIVQAWIRMLERALAINS